MTAYLTQWCSRICVGTRGMVLSGQSRSVVNNEMVSVLCDTCIGLMLKRCPATVYSCTKKFVFDATHTYYPWQNKVHLSCVQGSVASEFVLILCLKKYSTDSKVTISASYIKFCENNKSRRFWWKILWSWWPEYFIASCLLFGLTCACRLWDSVP